MNTWFNFLVYMRENPHISDRSMKSRSELYNKYKTSCLCGARDPICKKLGFKPICVKSAYNPHKDPDMLQAKIKAYEDIVKQKDIEIKRLIEGTPVRKSI